MNVFVFIFQEICLFKSKSSFVSNVLLQIHSCKIQLRSTEKFSISKVCPTEQYKLPLVPGKIPKLVSKTGFLSSFVVQAFQRTPKVLTQICKTIKVLPLSPIFYNTPLMHLFSGHIQDFKIFDWILQISQVIQLISWIGCSCDSQQVPSVLWGRRRHSLILTAGRPMKLWGGICNMASGMVALVGVGMGSDLVIRAL